MKMLRAYVLSYPIVLPAAFLVTWLAARLSLGFWPRASLDDPKFIGWPVDIPYTITMLLLLVGLPAFAIAVLSLACRARADRSQRKNFLLVSALATGLMVATICWLRWDPLGIVGWYMD